MYIYYIDITLGQKVPAIRQYREDTKSKQRYRILGICTYCPRISTYGSEHADTQKRLN